MNVTLQKLRTFLVVAEKQHFRQAADSLHLTQPAVSRQISELESELGVRLFDRNTRDVMPTAIGLRLQASLSRLLDELDATLAQTRKQGEGLSGTVRVAAGPTPSAELMPDCLAACARQLPGITLIASDRIQQQVVAAVLAGEVDFGLAIDPPSNPSLFTDTILYDPFVLVCRPQHPLAATKAVQWHQLKGEPLILLDHTSGSRRLIDAVLAEQQVDIDLVQETGHTHTAYRMVEAGLGATIQVRLSSPHSERLVVRPLLPEVKRAITLIRRRHQSLTPAAGQVWALLRQQASERQQETDNQQGNVT